MRGHLYMASRPHETHQPSNTVTPHNNPIPTYTGLQLAAAEERVFGENLVNGLHDHQRRLIDTNWHVIEGGTAQLAVVGIDVGGRRISRS